MAPLFGFCVHVVGLDREGFTQIRRSRLKIFDHEGVFDGVGLKVLFLRDFWKVDKKAKILIFKINKGVWCGWEWGFLRFLVVRFLRLWSAHFQNQGLMLFDHNWSFIKVSQTFQDQGQATLFWSRRFFRSWHIFEIKVIFSNIKRSLFKPLRLPLDFCERTF